MGFTSSDPNAVLKSLTNVFDETRKEIKDINWPKYARKQESDGAYEQYAFPTAVPFPREWIDERVPRSVNTNIVYQINNKLYELTMEFAESLLRDARAYNGLADMMAESAAAAVAYPDYLMAQLVNNSATAGYTAYDGQIFFNGSSNHLYAGAGSNYINNTYSASGQTIDCLRNDLVGAFAKLLTFKDDKNKLVNPLLKPDASNLTIVCSAALGPIFRQLLNSAWLPVSIAGTAASAAPAGDNVIKGMANLVVEPYLDATSATAWYLCYTSVGYRPFVMQEREPLRVKVLGFDSEFCNNTGHVRIMTRQRFAAGYFAFYRAIRVA